MKARDYSSSVSATSWLVEPQSSPEDRHVLDETAFRRMICLERKRTERSGNPLLLMMLESSTGDVTEAKALKTIFAKLPLMTRVTDIVGWFKAGSVMGVMFTEINPEHTRSVQDAIFSRIAEVIRAEASGDQIGRISVSFHLFPEESTKDSQPNPPNPSFYPELHTQVQSKRTLLLLKRLMDIAGSLLALAVCAPLFLTIAVAIRLTSRGPVLFRQPRVGHQGVTFNMLKFRSMHVDNDPSVHKEYVKKLVAGLADKQPTNGNGCGVYKLTGDTRITAVGSFLRRASLDELPQFINVLKGEMSLVGPRPPLAYEVEAYDVWHRRRLYEAKPGITGLWQVNGRNRLDFNDMVRLDLMYAKTWSPWLDLKILLRTPLAVIEGAH